MPFFRDTFTEASDVNLTAHTSDSSHTYADHPTINTGDMTVDATNGSVRIGTAGIQCVLSSVVPTSKDYIVRLTVKWLSTSGYIAVFFRYSASSNNGFFYRISNGEHRLFKNVSGTTTALSTWADTISAGDTRDIEIRCTDAAKTVIIDGTTRLSSTDNTFTDSGRIGIGSYSSVVTASATTGIHILDMSAEYIDTGGPKLSFLSDGSFISETGTGIAFTSGGQLVSETIETGSTIPESAAPVSGDGVVSAAGQKIAQGAAPVSGTGTITAAGQKVSAIPESAAPLSGHGVVSAAVSKVGQGSASVSGHGTVSAAGSKIGQRAAPLSGHGVVSAAGEEVSTIPTGSAPIADTGTISAAGRKIAQGSAPVADTGTIISSGQKNAQGSATLSSHGIVTATGINVDDIIVPPVEPEQPQAQLLPPDVSYWSKSVTKESNRRQQGIYQQLRAARRQRR